MYRPLTRHHKSLSLVAAACLSLPLLTGGCEGDVDAADKQVQEHLTEASEKRDPGVTSAPSVPEGYKKAAAVTSASPAVKAQALADLANAQRDRAIALLGEVDRLDVELQRIVGAINRQAARIDSNNTLVAGLRKFEPTKATQAIQQQRGAAQGEQKAAWVEHDSGAILGLKALNDQAAQLQEQIAQLEQQAKDLGTQRSKMISDAEQLEKQSEEAKAQQSSDLYNQSVDSRKQAADLGVQIEAVEAKLMPLRQDLERTKANQQAIARTVESMGSRLQATNEGWQKIQAEIAELQNLNKRILGTGDEPPPGPAPASQPQAAAQPEGEAAGAAPPRPAGAAAPPMAASIAGKLRQLNDTAGKIDSRRTEAESLLKEALDNIKKAGDAGAALSRDLQSRLSSAGGNQRPEAAAWKQLMELHHPARYKLRQATLDILLANLIRSRAADLDLRANMVQQLTAALQPDLKVPQEAGGSDLAAQRDAARQASLDLYKESEQLLGEVVDASAGGGDLVQTAAKAAHLMRLVRLYAQAQVDPETAKGLSQNAAALARQGDAVQLPTASLPPFLVTALELGAPATQPAASQPAGAGTTATPPPAPTGTTPPGTATPGTATPGTEAPGQTPPAGGTPPQ
jgi:hypothetical protein